MKKKKRTRKNSTLIELYKKAFQNLTKDRALLAKVLAIHAALYFLFVRANSAINQETLEMVVDDLGNDAIISTQSSVTIGSALDAFGGNSTEVNGLLSYAIILVFGLIYIRIVRANSFKKEIEFQNLMYRSTDQLIPFMLVSLLIVVQLIPFFITFAIFGFAASSDVAASLTQQLILFLLLVLGSSWSLFMISSSVPALYISSLDNSKPLESVRESKEAIKDRRFYVATAFLFFWTSLAIAAGLLALALVLIFQSLVLILLDLTAILTLPLFMAFFYEVYREVALNE